MIQLKHANALVLLLLFVVAGTISGIFKPLNHWFFDRMIIEGRHQSVASELITVSTGKADGLGEATDFLLSKGAQKVVALEKAPGQSVRISVHESGAKSVYFQSSIELPSEGVWRGPNIGRADLDNRLRAITGQPTRNIPGGRRLNFGVKRDAIPSLDFARIANGEIPENLIAGKTIFVGDSFSSETIL